MENLGDIDAQTIAGAIQTRTHGTGARVGGLATPVAGLELVTADGSLVRCSATERPDVALTKRNNRLPPRVGSSRCVGLATVTGRDDRGLALPRRSWLWCPDRVCAGGGMACGRRGFGYR
jgi:hypothetical protein